MQQVTDRLYSWASDIEQGTIDQALTTARLSIVTGHVALMPDAHVGMGSTVGSVRQAVPAGLGKWHATATDAAHAWFASNPPVGPLPDQLQRRARDQFGTLGSGNRFFEVCLDEDDQVWLVLHSGSRGVGNQLATRHIDIARSLADALEVPDLAYFTAGMPEFVAYIGDLVWAQSYAAANRDQMTDAALAAFLGLIGHGREVGRTNCHHNYTAREVHDGREMWITRKGAIRAGPQLQGHRWRAPTQGEDATGVPIAPKVDGSGPPAGH